MNIPAKTVGKWAWKKLGVCLKCVRTSLVALITVWSLFAVFSLTRQSILARISASTGGVLAALFFAHLIVWSLKVASTRVASRKRPSFNNCGFRDQQRRDLVLEFARAFAVGTLITTFGIRVTRVLAADCVCCCDSGTGVGNSRYNCTSTAKSCADDFKGKCVPKNQWCT